MASLTTTKHSFTWGERTYVMGVLNITPDSFSGDGLLRFKDAKKVMLEKAQKFIASGADILDVGGESTRPGSQPVDADEETRRVIPAIRAIIDKNPHLSISIDTYKSVVADAALESGASIVNDVWGLHADPELAKTIAHHNATVILMHNRSKPANAQVQDQLGGRYIGLEYENLLDDIKRELLESVAIAHSAGISDEHIILDPGIGFGKTVEQNLELLNRLDEIKALGFPVLLGPSRKSFIGYSLDLPPDQRLEGTAAAVAVGIVRGADIIRVHDVEFMVRVARMVDAIIRQK